MVNVVRGRKLRPNGSLVLGYRMESREECGKICKDEVAAISKCALYAFVCCQLIDLGDLARVCPSGLECKDAHGCRDGSCACEVTLRCNQDDAKNSDNAINRNSEKVGTYEKFERRSPTSLTSRSWTRP